MAHDLKYGKITAEHGDVTHGVGGVPLNESDEPCFVIRAQDISAPRAIRAYSDYADLSGVRSRLRPSRSGRRRTLIA